LLATFDRDDSDHQRCAELLAHVRGVRVVPAPVLVEFDYFAARKLGRRAMIKLTDEIAHGKYRIEDLIDADYQRVADLLRTYDDLRVGFVDAAVLAIVERLREPKLATLDQRHFTVMRPLHVDALQLLPA
jgi:predicted nucleic acid-binding protein